MYKRYIANYLRIQKLKFKKKKIILEIFNSC